MKLTDITPAPWNTRTAITDESVRSLAASMEADGLIQPISVCSLADGSGWICYDGNRRLAAAKLLGWTDIAVNCGDSLTLDEAKVRTITANLQREVDDPLLAAGVIASLLSEGMDAGQIAAKLGKTVAWVNRRRRMIGAADALKACADRVTVEALERVAVLPEAVQKRVCADIESKAKYMGRVGLNEIRYTIEREMRDLDAAAFDTSKCASCEKRTGAEQDLFGECETGRLGKCLDCKCFEKKRKAWEEAEITRLVGDAEVVRVQYAWQLPSSEKSTETRDSEHPCAYAFVNGGSVEVRWSESQKAKKAREEAEEKRREAERDAERNERKREDEIREKLDAWRDSAAENEYPAGLAGAIAKHMSEDYAVDAVADKLLGWHSANEWAEIVTAFPEICAFAGVSDDDRDYLVGRYADDENENENE